MQNPIAPPRFRNISDTARWVAVYRARESERPDAVFRDPFARRLAGARGEEIARDLTFADQNQWAFTARTFLVDHLIAREVQGGVDTVVNLAAGLDSRPYRMDLPGDLRWFEVDLPELLDYKDEILQSDRPVCKLERVRLDLSDVEARRGLFERIASQSRRVLVVSEGLLIYLSEDEVGSLAKDLATPQAFQRWIIDLSSPRLMRIKMKQLQAELSAAGAPFKFAPEAGVDFFRPYGWAAAEVRSMLKTAGKLKRLPWNLRLFSLLPEPKGPPGRRVWGGVCLLKRA